MAENKQKNNGYEKRFLLNGIGFLQGFLKEFSRLYVSGLERFYEGNCSTHLPGVGCAEQSFQSAFSPNALKDEIFKSGEVSLNRISR